MKQRVIVSALAGVLSLGLFVPHIVNAEEAPPTEAPYQETTTEPTEPTEDPATTTPAPSEDSTTFPTVYISPTTPAEPSSQPSVSYNQQIEETAVATVAPTVSSVSSMRLVTNLLVTLTPQSMRQSRIWSGF